MSDTDGVLAAIDSCMQDWSVSQDAMRMSPDVQALSYVEVLRRAATQGDDAEDPVSVSFHCNIASEESHERCTWLARTLKLFQCIEHDTHPLWLCSFHACIPAGDAFCRVCRAPMVEPAVAPDDLDRLIIDSLAGMGSTPEEREELRELYGTYLHQLVPGHLRRPAVSALPEEETQ